MNKDNNADKFNTLKEIIEELRNINRDAALYLWGNFDEEDFQNRAKKNNGPLDFFSWYLHGEFDYWSLLNDKLKQVEKKVNLNDYETEDIDFTGCDPVIAVALKQNKSILCKTESGVLNIVNYAPNLYIDDLGCFYSSAEPIKKNKNRIPCKRSSQCNAILN